MFNKSKLIAVVRLYKIKVVLIQLRDLLVQVFNGGLAC